MSPQSQRSREGKGDSSGKNELNTRSLFLFFFYKSILFAIRNITPVSSPRDGRGEGVLPFIMLGLSFLGVLSFLNSWRSPLDEQKKSMTLHKRSPTNVWPSPSPHNTEAKHWISLSLCHKTNLKFCAGNSLNKYHIRIFVKKHTSVNFNSERKCCGVDQTSLRDVTNVPTRSQSILSKLGKIHQELTVGNVHVVNYRVRDACLMKWDRINVNTGGGGGGTPIYFIYRDVPTVRVSFSGSSVLNSV